MTLKQELEILRGEPIQVCTGDPMDIPCIETSDPEKLCRHPVVSVQMITYNHEPYIRQAIEGVMMQKTDFEFELVIGEDASTDKTREICFEYQKKYPEKIRVLWAEENVSKKGGNGRRVRAHCRGEFIALCEGDDYWIDPLKLQKQVEIFRNNANVSFCCHRFRVGDGDQDWIKDRLEQLFRNGKSREGFFFTRDEYFSPAMLAQTATVMFRKSAYNETQFTHLGLSYDWVLAYVILTSGIGYFANEVMSVYRVYAGGVWNGMSEYQQVRWVMRRAMQLYERDSSIVMKQQYDYWLSRFKVYFSPYKQLLVVQIFLRRIFGLMRRAIRWAMKKSVDNLRVKI